MMKRETKEKLVKFADYLIEKYSGDESLYFNTTQYEKLSNKAGVSLAYETLRKYNNYLQKIIKNKIAEKEVESESVFTSQPSVSNLTKEVEYIIVRYSDGSEDKFIKEIKKIELVEEKRVWLGMFDYNDGTIIRKGKYSGCNVFDTSSIKEYFGGILNFYNHIKWCYEEGLKAKNGESVKFVVTPDTEKDMITLKYILDRLEAKINGKLSV